MYIYIYIIINIYIYTWICIYTKSDGLKYVYIYVWTRTAHMRARLSTCTNTYLHTHIHAHKLKHIILFFLCQCHTLFKNRVFYWKLMVGILWIFCLFVRCYKTRKFILRLPPWERRKAILVFPAFFLRSNFFKKIVPHNGLWYKYFFWRKNLFLELTSNQTRMYVKKTTITSRVVRAVVPIHADAAASVLYSAAVGGFDAGVLGPH